MRQPLENSKWSGRQVPRGTCPHRTGRASFSHPALCKDFFLERYAIIALHDLNRLQYYAWLDTIFRSTGKLEKAITYSLNQREYLCAFLDHGENEISNNQVENAIRPIVVGRKNWLFCGTQAGANASVIVFSVLETAKANSLNPEAYLNHLLTVLPERFATDPQAAVDDLLP